MPTHTENVSVATAPGEDDTPAATDDHDTEEPALLSMPVPPSKQPKPATTTPVFLIVVTVLCMVVLSALAVMIYLSSQ
jgi:hypothetical protein